MKRNANIKTAIVECRRDLREKLVSFINSAPGFLCTGNYDSIKNALTGFSRRLPDIVLCNLSFADKSETKVVRVLRANHPKLPILILNLYEDDYQTNEASGCLLKLALPAKLLKNFRQTLRDDAPVSDKVARNIFRSLADFLPPENGEYELTPHESRLLKLLVNGHNYTTAAVSLNVSYNTVKFHMRRVYQKLEVNSKSAAVAKVLRYRLIEE